MLYVTYFSAVLVALINTLSVYGQVDTPSFTRQTDDNYVKITEKFRKHIVDKNELRNIDNKTDLELYPHPLSEGFLEQFEYVMLDIGGMAPRDGWININAQYDDYHGDVTEEQKKNYVIRNMDNLYGFPDGSVSTLYSSHALEHTSASTGEAYRTLLEWRRVLRSGGMAMISVPDLETLCRLLLKKGYPIDVHWAISTVMFGGQRDVYDFHLSGFDEEILTGMLEAAGFCNIERVSEFRMFEHGADSSTVSFLGLPISLNIIARPCPEPDAPQDTVYFGHHGTPYFRPLDYEIPEYDSERKEFYTYRNVTLVNENDEFIKTELIREYHGYVFE